MDLTIIVAILAIVIWYIAMVAGYVWFVDRRDKMSEGDAQVLVGDVIEQFEQWNEKLETKQAALGFYNQLNDVCNHLFHNPLKLMITKEEFDNLTLNAIKQLNREALKDLRRQISEHSFS